MRERLAIINGTRARWRATFERFGTRTSAGYVKRMALFKQVMDARTGEVMTDHVWLNMTIVLERMDLQPNDRVEFDARVRPYMSGYHDNRHLNYRLSHPLNFVKLGVHDARGVGLLFSDCFVSNEASAP